MERNWTVSDDIPARLRPLEFEAHIRRQQESSSNVGIMLVSILMPTGGDDGLVMPEVPANEAVTDPIAASEEERRRKDHW